jgi:hypothetical protein
MTDKPEAAAESKAKMMPIINFIFTLQLEVLKQIIQNVFFFNWIEIFMPKKPYTPT